jgi:acetate kinase
MGASSGPIDQSVFERLHIDPKMANEALDTLLESREELLVISKQMSGQ